MKQRMLVILLIAFSACSSGGASVEELVAQLADTDPEIRGSAAVELAARGEAANKAVYPLSRLLRDDNDNVRATAEYALRKIGTHDAVRALNAFETRGMRL